MKPITYNLRGREDTSDQFYRDLALYVDILLGKIPTNLSGSVREYRDWIEKHQREIVRTHEEYIFDFLMTGVLWQQYITAARGLSGPKYQVLRWLYSLRRNYRWVKPAVDKLRGILSTLWLQKGRGWFRRANTTDLDSLHRLIRWLHAAGDFHEEAIRLELVADFLAGKPVQRRQAILENLLEFATRFSSESLEYFHDYTGNIASYIRENAPAKQWQENVIFCTRKEVEYLMNLVGAEIMNRAMAGEFTATQRKYALLPACMRQKPDQCQAKKLSLDMVCTGCDTACNIYKFREVGRENGFAVRIIPHSSDFSHWLKSWATGKDIGVIGVACPLHLIAGGLELRKLNIDAQCVFLDYCGCKTHWSEEGVMTDMNVNQLLKIVGARRQELAA